MIMIDPRITKQADILVNYSLKVKKGENVLILAEFAARPLVLEIYKFLLKAGVSEVRFRYDSERFSDEFSDYFFKYAGPEQIKHFPKIEEFEMKNVDCYIRIDAKENTRGLSSADTKKIAERSRILSPITDHRVDKTRWVVTKYPTAGQAQEADMSLSDYTDFVYNAINNVDWSKKFKEQEKLRKLVDGTKTVRIIGKGTDITLDIGGRRAANAGGEYNMPDGEVFTAPIESKTRGFITYTFPAIYMGKEFHDVRLEFKEGRVVKASAQKNEGDLNKILDMDEGSRILGELGIGNNFEIQKFTKDILFDEKIGGTVHLALGRGYKENGSKNRSGLHWDMIKDLRDGGELYFDGSLVQRNGKFIIK
jgi:aminopeptidase